MDREPQQMEVVIAGGGVAGLEALIALRALAGSRVRITVVAPEREFVYRPQSTGEPFGMGAPQRHALARIASDFGAELVPDRLEDVAPPTPRGVLESGGALRYDALILALGARQERAWPRAHLPRPA